MTSTADYSQQAKELVKAGEKNRAEIARWGLATAKLQKLLNAYQAANNDQEKAKADLQLATQAWIATKKALHAEIARWVSTLEANYGKSGDKLHEFGITPRTYKPRKGPRAKKG
jgi:hypothetical protein